MRGKKKRQEAEADGGASVRPPQRSLSPPGRLRCVLCVCLLWLLCVVCCVLRLLSVCVRSLRACVSQPAARARTRGQDNSDPRARVSAERVSSECQLRVSVEHPWPRGPFPWGQAPAAERDTTLRLDSY